MLTRSFPQQRLGLGLNKWGYIVANEETGETKPKRCIRWGDIVTGGATVILRDGRGAKSSPGD